MKVAFLFLGMFLAVSCRSTSYKSSTISQSPSTLDREISFGIFGYFKADCTITSKYVEVAGDFHVDNSRTCNKKNLESIIETLGPRNLKPQFCGVLRRRNWTSARRIDDWTKVEKLVYRTEKFKDGSGSRTGRGERGNATVHFKCQENPEKLESDLAKVSNDIEKLQFPKSGVSFTMLAQLVAFCDVEHSECMDENLKKKLEKRVNHLVDNRLCADLSEPDLTSEIHFRNRNKSRMATKKIECKRTFF